MPAEKINLNSLKKGDVITFYYTSGSDERPVVLYLNTFNGLIHGLNLNYLTSGQLVYLKNILKNKMYAIYSIDNPKTFYDNELKPTGVSVAYRTYNPTKIVNLNRIGYKTETLEKDLGLKPKKETTQQKTSEQKYTTKPQIKTTLPDKIIPNTSTLPDDIFGLEK